MLVETGAGMRRTFRTPRRCSGWACWRRGESPQWRSAAGVNDWPAVYCTGGRVRSPRSPSGATDNPRCV